MKISAFALSKNVGEGEVIPRFYGLAYWDFCSNLAYFYPIPLNLIIRLAREFYYLLVRGLFPDTWYNAIQKNEDRIYIDTWQKAWDNGYESGKKDERENIKEAENLLKELINMQDKK